MHESPTLSNGSSSLSRSEALDRLLRETTDRVVSFVAAADGEVKGHQGGQVVDKSTLVEQYSLNDLTSQLEAVTKLPEAGTGIEGYQKSLDAIFRYSVNTSSPGFLDKLYAAPLPPGVAAELVLAALNTNVHVYQVSPVLTVIEKHTSKTLAKLFGLDGPRAGGVSVQGGSASNTTSIVIARNTLYPETKTLGNNAGGLRLALFTSAHGHYSIEKAAQQCGFGSAAVVSVPVDSVTGRMLPAELERLILESKAEGMTPFYVNATAGTTVLGSFDPFAEISHIAKTHNMWLHIDGAWGGSFIFSEDLAKTRLSGSHLADSIAINPHKMMGVPVTCSFLLAKDLKQFHDANTLKAGYLFHDPEEDSGLTSNGQANGHTQLTSSDNAADAWTEPRDLADMTLQCGRRGDSLKLFLSWQYYGTSGYRQKVESAYATACHLADLVASAPDLSLVSSNPPPCLQVCFYYTPVPSPEAAATTADELQSAKPLARSSSSQVPRLTERIAGKLIQRGFMVDFAPALAGQEGKGKFFRVVVNISTPRETVERLVKEIREVGREICTVT
jgi:glutamate decarboxylase